MTPPQSYTLSNSNFYTLCTLFLGITFSPLPPALFLPLLFPGNNENYEWNNTETKYNRVNERTDNSYSILEKSQQHSRRNYTFHLSEYFFHIHITNELHCGSTNSLWICFYLLVDATGLNQNKKLLKRGIQKKVKILRHKLPQSTNMGNSLISVGNC